jgi:hypothetical protein
MNPLDDKKITLQLIIYSMERELLLTLVDTYAVQAIGWCKGQLPECFTERIRLRCPAYTLALRDFSTLAP